MTHRTNAFSGIPVVSWLLPLALVLAVSSSHAAELFSASVDLDNDRIIVRGAGFDNSTSISLGGVEIPASNVTPDQLELVFGAEIYTAVQWQANYALVADDSVRISLYIDAPISEPPPPPPPPPPPGGTDCPCSAGWEASGIDNAYQIVSCTDGVDGTQNYISGFGIDNPWFFAAAFDPNNIFFDEADPGNSISFCAADDGTGYTVALPVTNEDQYWSCYEHLWVNICF